MKQYKVSELEPWSTVPNVCNKRVEILGEGYLCSKPAEFLCLDSQYPDMEYCGEHFLGSLYLPYVPDFLEKMESYIQRLISEKCAEYESRLVEGIEEDKK